MKQLNKSRVSVPVERKENLVCHPSMSQASTSKSSVKLNRNFKAKSRKELSLKAKNISTEKLSKSPAARKKTPVPLTSQKLKLELNTQLPENEKEDEELHLREICFIKSTEGKTMIAKYKNKESEEFDDNLIVSWDAPTSKATVFTHKSSRVPSAPSFLHTKAASEPGTSKQGAFRIHNFSKSALKSKFKKPTLRRLVSATELGKLERKKKKKLRIK